MHNERVFLQALQDKPEDTTLRLVFADWLEERGDPRSELIRLLHLLTQSVEVPERSNLEERLRGLVWAGVQPVGPFITNSLGMQFALIPAGKFMMGSSVEDRKKVEQHFKDSGQDPENYKEYLDREQPQHEVEITEPFHMGVYQVTQEEWETVMGKDENRSYFRKGGGGKAKVKGLDTRRFPVENVSWNDTQKFLAALNKQGKEKGEKYLYRLPTEAEWEYACRGGSTSLYHFGDKLTYHEAVFNWDYPIGSNDKKTYLGRPVAVDDKNYQPNAFGLYHMHGNVWEWCADRFDANYYQTCVDQKIRQNPQGPQHEDTRFVLRGGSWFGYGWYCCSANRGRGSSDGRYNFWGFRVVCVRSLHRDFGGQSRPVHGSSERARRVQAILPGRNANAFPPH